jgi:hypothetical protein
MSNSASTNPRISCRCRIAPFARHPDRVELALEEGPPFHFASMMDQPRPESEEPLLGRPGRFEPGKRGEAKR